MYYQQRKESEAADEKKEGTEQVAKQSSEERFSVTEETMTALLDVAEEGRQPDLSEMDRSRVKEAQHFAKYAHACYGFVPFYCRANRCLAVHDKSMVFTVVQGGRCMCMRTLSGGFAASSLAKHIRGAT